MLHRPLSLIIAALAFWTPWSLAHATTYYVRAAGDDTRDGLSPATAFASIKPAARLLQNPGDQLIVGPGNYNEGNIKPRGSGSAEEPIVFHADVTGALTHDPPGPVTIEPPNTADATTGIIVFGRHDIIIDGFAVDGAADAGIQVRPHSRTGADSSNIVVRNNSVRNGARKGIHIIAAGDVSVIGNTMVRNAGAGLALMGGTDAALRPIVSDNVVDENRFGIVLQRTTGGTVTQNKLRSNDKGLTMSECDGLTIINNEIVALSSGGITGRASNVTILENVIERAGGIWASGACLVANNRFTSLNVNLKIYLEHEEGTLKLLGNQLPRTYVGGGKQIEVTGNDGELLAVGSEAVTLTDNTFAKSIKASAVTNLEVSRNQTDHLEARAQTAVIRDNQLTGWMDVLTATATVAGNRAGRVLVARRQDYRNDDDPDSTRGPYLVEGNVSETTLRVGFARSPLASVVIQDNVAGEMLQAFGRGDLQVKRNETRGIACILSGADSRLTVSENTSRQSAEAGLIVIGATSAVIENNTSAENLDSGLAARGIRNLTIAGNTFRANPSGGISVLVPLAGDCNSNLDVTVDELVTVVRIVLGQRELYACRAADVSGDEIITIDEIMLAAGAAYDRPDIHAGTVEIRNNRVEDNGRFGINVSTGGSVLATDNRVLRNGGIAVAMKGRGRQDGTAIVGNLLGASAAEGLLLTGIAAARVRNNVIFSNRETGILLRDAPRTAVINNLIYANGDDGISVGVGADRPAPAVTLGNNTIYANAGWGVTLGTAGAPSKGTVVMNNIIHDNLHGGIAAETDSGAALTREFNLNNDFNYPTVPDSATDFEGDPRFVAAAGPDGILGGAGFEDDDLHLQPGTPISAAIDTGSAPAAELGITGSAVAGQTSDSGIVDVGFHYGAQ